MNAMKKLIAYYGDSPVYVEGFPKDCARSCKGSVHILPRKSVTVTEDEYKYILDKYSWMKPKLKVVAEVSEGATPKDSKKDSKESSKESNASAPKEKGKKPKDKNGAESEDETEKEKKGKSTKKKTSRWNNRD